MSNVLVEYLSNSKTLSVVQKFLKTFNGLEMKLLDMEGKPIQEESLIQSSIYPGLPVSSLIRLTQDVVNSRSFQISLDNIAQTIENKEVISVTDQGDNSYVLIPVIHQDQVVCTLALCGRGANMLRQSHQHSVVLLVQEMLKNIIDQDFKMLADFKGNELTPQKKVMCRVIKYIRDNYHRATLTLNQTAQENNVSYYYLSHLFKKELKTSFSNYLNDVRLNAASKLLQDKGLTISQICFFCGYSDPCYFSKVFKKWCGKSPINARSKKRKFSPPQPRYASSYLGGSLPY